MGRRGVTTRATFHGRPWNLPTLLDSDKLSEYTALRPIGLQAHQGDEPATTRTKCPNPALHQSVIAYGFDGQVWPELARPGQLGRSNAYRRRDKMSRRLPAHAASGWLEVDFRFSPSPCHGQYPPSRWQLSCRGGLARPGHLRVGSRELSSERWRDWSAAPQRNCSGGCDLSAQPRSLWTHRGRPTRAGNEAVDDSVDVTEAAQVDPRSC